MLKLIRRATNKDIDKINALGEQLHHNFIKNYHIETEITNKIAIVLVADINNIVGYLYALDLGDNIDLLSIFVDKKTRYPEYQQGVKCDGLYAIIGYRRRGKWNSFL